MISFSFDDECIRKEGEAIIRVIMMFSVREVVCTLKTEYRVDYFFIFFKAAFPIRVFAGEGVFAPCTSRGYLPPVPNFFTMCYY